jgi:AdoMet-dependent heme synthase
MIEVTNRCNLSCGFCFNKLYVPQKRKSQELSTSNIKNIIDKIKESKIPIVRFTGGEPLLRGDIFELMDYAYKKGLKVWLNTNATLITKPIAGKIAKYVENVLISLNAHTCASEMVLTGSNTFKSKLKGIILLKKSKIKYLRCGTVATKVNIANLEKIHGLVKRLEVSDWELFRVIPLSNDNVVIDNNDIALLVEKLLKINKIENKNYKIANAIPFCAYDPQKVSKVALGSVADDGHMRFVINSDGDARPMYYLNEHIGNILTDDISMMWKDGFMKKMRTLRYVPDICRRCKYIETCKGGSRTVANIVGGDYRALDYLSQPYKYENYLK